MHRTDAERERDASRRMGMDDLFLIASKPKPFTATTVMRLHNDGRLSIDDPGEDHPPEFKGQWMLALRDTDSLTPRRLAAAHGVNLECFGPRLTDRSTQTYWREQT